jgi:SET domain-containing protein
VTEDIGENFLIGITHVRDNRFDNGFIRTPIGGFFNHSETPNCKIEEHDDILKLITIRPIKCGEEITAKYTLYIPNKK